MAGTDDEKQAAAHFAEIFCNLLDKHRDQLAAYLADDAVLDWFGRTVSSKDSIAEFMNLKVPETVHSLSSVEPSGPIKHRKMVVEPVDIENGVTLLKGQTRLHASVSGKGLAEPLDSPDCMVQVTCSKHADIMAKLNLSSLSLHENGIDKRKSLESFQSQFLTPMNYGIPVGSEQCYGVRYKEDKEDCLYIPSVKSFTKPNRFLEAVGSIQFQRTRQSDTAPKNMKLTLDTMKWHRFCKLQIAYSTPNIEFHTNDGGDGIAGEFKIWLLVYQSNTRCRKNLSEAFDKVE
jgi:hypothetical protein